MLLAYIGLTTKSLPNPYTRSLIDKSGDHKVTSRGGKLAHIGWNQIHPGKRQKMFRKMSDCH
jgi:hypothetical protein